MKEKEVMAQQIAGDHHGLSLEDDPVRAAQKGRLYPQERKCFDAGWEAARQFYTEAHAGIAERMRPTGGRMWTDEQRACFSALTDCAETIRSGEHNVQD